MHEPHISETFADDADLFEVDQAWLEELDDDDGPITIRNRRPRRSGLALGAVVAGAALAAALVRWTFIRRSLRRQRLSRGSLAAALGALAATAAAVKIGIAGKTGALLEAA
jgi:hypothetical protein